MTKEKKEKKSKKKKVILNPKIEQYKSKLTGYDLAKEFLGSKDDYIIENSKDSGTDSYFREIISQLMSEKNISMKTEYDNDDEIFSATKLEHISKACNVPLFSKFLDRLEMRRVSKGRKGRIELLLGLEKREQEIEERARRLMVSPY